MPIKEVIKQMLSHRGVTQGSAAQMAGWSSQAGLSQAIGRRSPSLNTLLRICDALGFDIIVRDRCGSSAWVLTAGEEEKK